MTMFSYHAAAPLKTTEFVEEKKRHLDAYLDANLLGQTSTYTFDRQRRRTVTHTHSNTGVTSTFLSAGEH